MGEKADTIDRNDVQSPSFPEWDKNKCFACGAPVEWPHQSCEFCQKLSEFDCV